MSRRAQATAETEDSRHRSLPVPLPLPPGLDRDVAVSLGRAAGRALDGVVPGRGETFARAEREALCRTALRAGPEAPTLCGDWDVQTLVAHLVVREREPLGAAGIVVPPLEHLTDRSVRRRVRAGLAANIERLRRPGLHPFAVPVVDRLANTMEFFVHHEDIRRAGDGGPPRALSEAGRHDLWAALRVLGGVLVRHAGMSVALRRTDAAEPRQAEVVVHPRPVRRGAPVTVVGDTGELALFCYGRGDVADVRLEGDEVSVRRLRNIPLGL